MTDGWTVLQDKCCHLSPILSRIITTPTLSVFIFSRPLDEKNIGFTLNCVYSLLKMRLNPFGFSGVVSIVNISFDLVKY
jgi:hypothetical protein